MIDTLDQQLIGRYFEMLKAHPELEVCDAPVCESMGSQTSVERALAGKLTHIMFVKGDKIYVGWWDSLDFQWFFDCYAT